MLYYGPTHDLRHGSQVFYCWAETKVYIIGFSFFSQSLLFLLIEMMFQLILKTDIVNGCPALSLVRSSAGIILSYP